jgi:hypothetical protein
LIGPLMTLELVPARGVGEDDTRSRCLDPPPPPRPLGDEVLFFRFDIALLDGEIGGLLEVIKADAVEDMLDNFVSSIGTLGDNDGTRIGGITASEVDANNCDPLPPPPPSDSEMDTGERVDSGALASTVGFVVTSSETFVEVEAGAEAEAEAEAEAGAEGGGGGGGGEVVPIRPPPIALNADDQGKGIDEIAVVVDDDVAAFVEDDIGGKATVGRRNLRYR